MKNILISTSLAAGLLAFSTASFAEEMVRTPFGEFPKECVHEHPHGTTIEEVKEGLKATHTDGTVKIIPHNPKCDSFHKNMKKQNAAINRAELNSNITPISWEWFNYTSWTAPDTMTNYTATYTVPDTPTNVKNQTLFYFIGIQDNTSPTVSIIQPVLGFENQQWNISSWNCCLAGQVHFSPFIYGMNSGDTISGIINATSSSTYSIQTIWNSQPTTLNTTVGSAPFTWANATLEVYSINTCDEFSSGPMVFSNIQMSDANGTLSPNWTLNPAGGTTECSGQLTVNGNSIIVQQNIPSYTDINAGPIWNQQDAMTKCPKVCAEADRKWSGKWNTTEPGIMSVCGCAYN